MTRTAEITTSVESIRSGIADTRGQAVGALERARNLAEQAGAHGWQGLAASMQAAGDALETVVASLDTAESAADEAVSGLQTITDQMSSADVAAHLGQVVQQFDQMRTAIDAAGDSTDAARQAGQQTGEPSELMGMLQGVSDGLDGAWRSLGDAKGKAESERREAENWGN